MDLTNKKVIVTGGARGLGRAMVECFRAAGSQVTVFDIDSAALTELQGSASGVNWVKCDVSDREQVIAAADRFHSEFGAVDVLINNAGILFSAPLVRITSSGVERHDFDEWERVVNADLHSVFYVTACVVEKMIASRTKGVVVNISSVSAAGNPGASAYSAAKAGVNALTRAWAKELGPMGIRVLAVAPGFTTTESARQAMSENALRETIKRVPLRRLGEPEEIAEGVLAVVRNDFFNGKVVELDGGLTF